MPCPHLTAIVKTPIRQRATLFCVVINARVGDVWEFPMHPANPAESAVARQRIVIEQATENKHTVKYSCVISYPNRTTAPLATEKTQRGLISHRIR